MSATRALVIVAVALALSGCASFRRSMPSWSGEPAPPPADRAAAERARIDREVADLLHRGRLAVAQARRYYVAAAALDPNSRAAREALRGLPASEPVVRAEPPVKPTASPVLRIESARDDEKPEVLYAAARSQLADGRDDDAYRTLVHLGRVNAQYKDSAALLRNLRARLVQQHYHLGLILFREEKIEEAIAEWRLVLDMDGGHANARRNIEQAERILRTLAEQQPLTATPR